MLATSIAISVFLFLTIIRATFQNPVCLDQQTLEDVWALAQLDYNENIRSMTFDELQLYVVSFLVIEFCLLFK